MKHFLIEDFGTIVDCNNISEVPEKLGYKSRKEMIRDNGFVEPDIVELTDDEYAIELLYETYAVV